MHTRSWSIPLLFILLISPVLAWAQVRDATGTFSSPAIQEADGIMRQIRQQSQRQMLVEVFATIPPERRAQYQESQKQQFFSAWARQRAGELNVNGIYVLVTRDPGHLEVAVGNETQKRAFTLNDVSELRNLMLASFRQKQFDRGLLDGTRFVQQTMQRNLSGAARAPVPGPARTPVHPSSDKPGVSGLSCFMIGLIGIGALLLFRLFRRRSDPGYYAQRYGGNYPPPPPGQGYPPPPPGYGADYGGGGGGWGRGLLGGLLGAAAGGWLYDRFFRGGTSYGSPPPDTGGGYQQPPGGYQAPDTDYTSTGGDFGGGSDFGGGDSGGGDSGGDF